jgi:NADH:ubiquinone oxidoreductase subunit 4 (subunit M)
MYGEVTNPKNANLPDLNGREWATLLPLVFLSLFMGVFSSLFTPSLEKPIMKIIQDANAKASGLSIRLRTVPAPAPASPQPPADEGAHQ